MITSILDTDLYKMTMMFSILSNKELSNLKVRYQFFNRNDVKFPEGFDIELKKRVQDMSKLYLKPDEKRFFKEKCGHYINDWFFDFIEGYRFDPNEVFIYMEDGNLKVKIEGMWYRSILWEVPLLAIISELYFEMTSNYDFNNNGNRQTRLDNNMRKANLMVMNNLKVSEFGTRRRFSYENQKEVLGDLLNYGKKSITGTSNIHLAHIFNINCHGTQAHEWFQVHQIYGFQMANTMALNHWSSVFNGFLGTCLPDTLTTDVFLRSFDSFNANLYSGVRWDSGEWKLFTDKFIHHYNKLKIDYSAKTLVYSDGLNIELGIEITNYCNKVGIHAGLGIGTYLSNNITNNDVPIKPLNAVIKVTQVYYNGIWLDLIKLSDSTGKHTGKIEQIELCKKILNIPDITYNHNPAGNEEDKPKINEVI